MQLQDAIALFGHHVLRQPKLLELYLLLTFIVAVSFTGVHRLLRLLQLFFMLSLVLLYLAEQAAEIRWEALRNRLLLLVTLLHQVTDRVRWGNLGDLGWNIGSLLGFLNGRPANYFTDCLKKD